MSRILAELLGVEENLFAMEMSQLEYAAGLPGHDVRLTAEIIGKVHMKARQLGLDPSDTTGEELYGALLNLVGRHDGFLATKLGAKDPADVADLLPRIRGAALKADMPNTAWVLKPRAAKRLIRQYPPKRVMKYLGYKSLDSMLKRESAGELFAGIYLLESRKWLQDFMGHYDSLSQMDFEVRPIEIIQLAEKRWSKAAKAYMAQQRHIILPIREIGVIIMLPPPFKRRAGLTITVLLHLLHHINEIRLYSAYYKLHQMRLDFGRIMAKSLLHDEGNHVEVGGQLFHWRVVQRHFGKAGYHPEVLEPHVQAEDLSWKQAEEVLYRMEPALHFWHGYDYVGTTRDGQPLSFNLLDAALNNLNHIPYEQRLCGHFRESLWNQLFGRYLREPALEAAALRQLDYDGPDSVDAAEMLLVSIGDEDFS